MISIRVVVQGVYILFSRRSDSHLTAFLSLAFAFAICYGEYARVLVVLEA